MRFLIDQNRSPHLAGLLRDAGHDAVHAIELGLERAADNELLSLAVEEHRIVVSGDTDFGMLLATMRAAAPSVVLFRTRHLSRAEQQATVMLRHLEEIGDDLERGAVVVVTDDRIRVRHLPLIDGG
ncbi:MAG: hypothetical protein F4117_01090 [Acidimicrobiales bacterium]|nr:DUF5615 family PIN-like protein [Acidimicrobiaceae bacterium]MXV87278.1 hypothetical protein [Acidimicrobiales bacterium]MCY3608735.1 DUF5615 family PIN-like protein [Acidimicrobiaceae bacterium]MXX41942.1 hypothetical protein [Acidimicrobiales bacterium]MXY02630.1 hypothetical protein [Acidimicrobiales bacterium]